MELVASIGKMLATDFGVGEVEARHMTAIIEAANCLCAEFNRDHESAKVGGGLQMWIGSDEVGSSSLCMARTLAPIAGLGHCPAHQYLDEVNFPYDPSDFGRCVNLLNVVPELRPHIQEMAAVHPVWAAYVARWAEMEALCNREKYSLLYTLMKKLRKEATA
jgi:hypothetical protein